MTGPWRRSRWVSPKKSPSREVSPVMSERLRSWAWPLRATGPVMVWAAKEEPELLMWASTGPVMRLSSISPWLEVMVTGARRSEMLMVPWPAVTVVGLDSGRVMVRSEVAPADPGDGDVEGGAEELEAGAEVLFAVGDVGVGVDVELLGDGDVDVVVVGSADDGDVAVWVVDGKAGAGGEGLVDLLCAVVAFAEDFVDVVGVDAEAVGEEVGAVADAVEDGAGDGEEDEEEDGSAADAAADGDGLAVGAEVGGEVLVDEPFDEEDDAGGDEKEGPPAAVPGGEAGEGQAAEADEQDDDADGDDEERAEDGAAAVARGPADGGDRAGIWLA